MGHPAFLFGQGKYPAPSLDSYAAMPHNPMVNVPMLTVVETSAFIRRAEKLLSAEEHEELLFYLALHPLSGDEIPGTGGVRKVRFAARGKGKSGGVRVIYYFFDEENPLYAIFLYGKNEQANLTPEQKREVAGFAATIKAAAKVRRIRE
jgi:mRNA-degrading endonuclease RelE of RelBE toxin-antitoxin system